MHNYTALRPDAFLRDIDMNNAIKLSVIASALTFAISSASAAQVYNKDDTTLDIGGYVDAVYWSGHNDLAGDGDQSVSDRMRFGLSGRTKLTDGIYGFGVYQVQNEHGDKKTGSSETVDTSLRYAYVGVDFGKFGTLEAGRDDNGFYKKIESVTDVFERLGEEGAQFAARNSSKISYEISYAGFSAALEYQAAVDSYSAVDFTGDVNNGYNAALGYTSPDVLFGPIGIQVAYNYLNFQDTKSFDKGDKDEDDKPIYYNADDSKTFGVALTWGNYGDGLYLASFYEQSKIAYNTVGQDDDKIKSSETAVSYGFANGIVVQAEYTWKDYVGYDDVSSISRKSTVFVGYNASENFFVWADCNFDAGSSDDVNDDTKYTVGARFVF